MLSEMGAFTATRACVAMRSFFTRGPCTGLSFLSVLAHRLGVTRPENKRLESVTRVIFCPSHLLFLPASACFLRLHCCIFFLFFSLHVILAPHAIIPTRSACASWATRLCTTKYVAAHNHGDALLKREKERGSRDCHGTQRSLVACRFNFDFPLRLSFNSSYHFQSI